MRNAQWIHIMHPDYRDTKLFLNILILILLDDTKENGEVFQIAKACEKKRRNKKSLCKSGVVEG